MITSKELAKEMLAKLESIRDKVEPDAISNLNEAIEMAKLMSETSLVLAKYKSKFRVKHLRYRKRKKSMSCTTPSLRTSG